MLQRKTPLKANPKPLQRKTPLQSGGSLKSGSPLRSKPLAPRSSGAAGRASGGSAKASETPRKPLQRKPMERKPPERKPPAERKPIERKPVERKPPGERKSIVRKPPGTAPSKPKKPAPPKRLREGEVGEAKTRKLIRARSTGICEICGGAPATDAAHRKARSAGGLWSPSNILDACHGCHMFNHANPAQALHEDNGWHLNSWCDPTTAPALIRHLGVQRLMILADDGTTRPHAA